MSICHLLGDERKQVEDFFYESQISSHPVVSAIIKAGIKAGLK